MQIAIKIDVDTRIGTVQGIPRLLEIFKRHNVRASFFGVLGPDNSGKAIRRVFTRSGFVGKMVRTNPLKIYGLRTLLYGTILPAPMTGLAHPELLRRIPTEGHELGLHAYDHVLWQDYVSTWDRARIQQEYRKAFDAFAEVTGVPPKTVAAPGWQATPESLRVQDSLGLTYASDSRGTTPFFPSVEGQRLKTLQIPGTLPTVDEVLGLGNITEANVVEHLEAQLQPDRLNVYTGHAEIEGMYLSEPFARLVERLARRGAQFVTLAEVAEAELARRDQVVVCSVVPGEVPGRAGFVACQGANA
jgi:undecaprenyl phosphate-alpha-L-ara4FN deformylase